MAKKPTADTWKKCPPGTFSGLSEKLQRKQSRRQFLRSAVTFAGVGLVGIGGGTGIWLGVSTLRGGLTCDQAQQFAQAYINGELSQPVHDQVRTHALNCSRCRPLFEEMGATF